jgi:hypothetical protein
MSSQTFVELTKSFESWFAQHSKIVKKDLALKHSNMASSPFLFLRATFYAWVKRYWENCPELVNDTPVVLAVGDLHVENFGTWRDAEGRLCWGCNDVDEAFPLPYTLDLVRLAASAKMAIAEEHLNLTTREACEAILEGYIEMLAAGGRGFVLGEEHLELRAMAVNKLRIPAAFWVKLKNQLTPTAVPPEALASLEAKMPDTQLKYKFGQRTAGQGSLGRPRFVAMADLHGGLIAREAKVALPSACVWAGLAQSEHIYYQELIDHAFRSKDPYVGLEGGWIVRRLSPDCSRVELTDLPKNPDEHLLMRAMGAETANIHLGQEGAAAAILADLKKRKPNWLRKAVKKMVKVTRADQKQWAKHHAEQQRQAAEKVKARRKSK